MTASYRLSTRHPIAKGIEAAPHRRGRCVYCAFRCGLHAAVAGRTRLRSALAGAFADTLPGSRLPRTLAGTLTSTLAGCRLACALTRTLTRTLAGCRLASCRLARALTSALT